MTPSCKSPIGVDIGVAFLSDNCPLFIFRLFEGVRLVIAPAGFWPLGQNPRTHPRSPRVYTYKDKDIFVEKVRNVFVMGEAFSI